MADKFQNKYRIPSARASWHDYNGGDYFITICTGGREHYFGEIVNGEMILNDLGIKLNELIAELPTHHPYTKIPVYQIMPNHVHLIVCIDDTTGRDAVDRDAAGRDAADRDAAGRDAAGRDAAGRDAAGRDATGRDAADRDAADRDAAGRDAACHVSTTTDKKMQEIANQCG